jgi:hypothetical protein
MWSVECALWTWMGTMKVQKVVHDSTEMADVKMIPSVGPWGSNYQGAGAGNKILWDTARG